MRGTGDIDGQQLADPVIDLLSVLAEVATRSAPPAGPCHLDGHRRSGSRLRSGGGRPSPPLTRAATTVQPAQPAVTRKVVPSSAVESPPTQTSYVEGSTTQSRDAAFQ